MKLGGILAGRGAEFGTLKPTLETTGGHLAPVSGFTGKLKTIDPQKIMARIIEDDLGKSDIVTTFADVNFTGLNSLTVKDHGQFSFTDGAFEQLCQKLNVPSAYLKKCPMTGRAGRQEQMEYWRDQVEDHDILLRVKRFSDTDNDGTLGQVRAVLSKTYEPIDNMRLFQWVDAAMERANGNLGIIYARVGDTSHFRLCFSDPINIGTDETPDLHYFGLHVSDSEVGGKALTMDYMLYRLACMNGLIMEVEGEKLMHQKHIHVDHTVLGRSFQEAIDIALEHRDSLIDTLESARSQEIRDPYSVIRRIVKLHRGTGDFANLVIAAYEADPPPPGTSPTKYQIVQAFTRAARRMPMDRRTQVETMAGTWLAEAAA